MKNLIKKYKEPILYLIFGGLTTLINIIVYFIFYKKIGLENGISNIIAWFFSVLFAYVTNKLFVFNSKGLSFKAFILELISFFSCRLLTGFIDLAFMLVTVDLLKLDTNLLSFLMKIISNVFVIILNFFLSKKVIFNKGEKKSNKLEILIIALISLLASSFLFNKGLAKGDDYNFHISLCYDLYLSGLNGNFLFPLNEKLLSGLGYGARLYYAPLFEYSSVFIALLFKNYGINLMTSIKILIYLMYFFSGLFMYYGAKRVFKEKKISLILAILYIIMPYRSLNIVLRSAYSEALAMTFIPLVFFSLYEILTMKEFHLKPFFSFVLGFALLFLSHTITSFYTVFFLVIFSLFYILNFAKNLKNYKYTISLISSILLIIGLVSFYLFPLLKMLNSGDYIISDKENMGATISNLFATLDGVFAKAGFIDFRENTTIQIVKAMISLIIILMLFSLEFIYKLGNTPLLKRLIIFIVPLLTLCYIYEFNVTVISGVILYVVIYMITFHLEIKKENFNKKLLTVSLIELGIIILFLTCPYIYKILPSFFLNILFTFRLYTFVSFFLSLIIGLLIKNKSLLHKGFIPLMALLFVVLSSTNQYKKIEYMTEIDDYILDANINGQGGWQHEYLPKEFKIKGVHPTGKSLFYDVYHVLNRNGTLNCKIDPLIVEGSGSIEEDLIIINSDEAEVEFARLYYDGYVIYLHDESNMVYEITPYKKDGLLCATLSEGRYQVEIIYKGTKTLKISRLISIVSLGVYVISYFTYLIIGKE